MPCKVKANKKKEWISVFTPNSLVLFNSANQSFTSKSCNVFFIHFTLAAILKSATKLKTTTMIMAKSAPQSLTFKVSTGVTRCPTLCETVQCFYPFSVPLFDWLKFTQVSAWLSRNVCFLKRCAYLWMHPSWNPKMQTGQYSSWNEDHRNELSVHVYRMFET